MFYIVGTENCSRIDQTDYIFEKGEYALGGNVGFGGIRTTDKPRGSLSAVDIVTGQVKEQITLTFPSVSGILSTAGGVIFSATLDGTVSAYHNQTLEQLWSMNLGTGFSAPPMTYAVDGKQYVAILAGSSRISAGHGRGIPELANVNPTHMLFVFAL